MLRSNNELGAHIQSTTSGHRHLLLDRESLQGSRRRCIDRARTQWNLQWRTKGRLQTATRKDLNHDLTTNHRLYHRPKRKCNLSFRNPSSSRSLLAKPF
jgi:hypothetical protein